MQQKKEANSLEKFLIFNKDFLAGCAAGVACALIGQPFDTIKVRIQSSETKTTMGQVIKNLIQKDGPLAIYRGVSSPLLTLSIIESIRFGGQQQTYRYLNKVRNSTSDFDLLVNYSIGGSVGSIISGFLTNPMEHVRIKMQLMEAGKTQYNNTWQCLIYILKNHGITGLNRGLVPCLLREGVGYFFYFGIYEYLLKKFKSMLDDQNDPNKIIACQLTAGPIAGVCFWTSIYPLDNIKSRMQGDNLSNPRYKGMINVFQQLTFKQLWSGWVPCVVRALPANAGVFFAWESTKSYIDNLENKIY